MSALDQILGPRVPNEELSAHRARYRLPGSLFALAALLLTVSIFFPYWFLRLKAPQFPKGLVVQAYVNRLTGDVRELEELNHYIGMKSFASGAVFERSISIAAICVLAGLMLAGLFIHSRWVVVFVLPALVFPLIFIVDLQWWLWRYGHELDPSAPLADAVGDFTPRVFGKGQIAQFDTYATPDVGLILAIAASILVLAGLVFHRRAYKPLVEPEAGAEATNGDGSDDPDPDDVSPEDVPPESQQERAAGAGGPVGVADESSKRANTSSTVGSVSAGSLAIVSEVA